MKFSMIAGIAVIAFVFIIGIILGGGGGLQLLEGLLIFHRSL
ncbi:hypothetical protein ACFL60_05030 [Candidatus Omnitrophota bacterium]